MKKIILIIISLIISVSFIYGQQGRIARFPFTGTAIDNGSSIGSDYAKKIQSELTSLGYKFVSRDSELQAILEQEVKFQRAYNRKDYINAATMVNADYALTGTINMINNKYDISVSLVNLATLEEIVVNKSLYSLNDQEAKNAVIDIAGEIDAKLNGTKYVSVAEKRQIKQQQNIKNQYNTYYSYERGYRAANVAKWVGRVSWIVGIGLIIVPFAIDAKWGNHFGYFLTTVPDNMTYGDYGQVVSSTGGMYSKSDLNIMRGVFYTGIGLFAGGLITDIVSSSVQGYYKNKMNSGYYSFAPIIVPYDNGAISYGAEFRFSYQF